MWQTQVLPADSEPFGMKNFSINQSKQELGQSPNHPAIMKETFIKILKGGALGLNLYKMGLLSSGLLY